MSWETPTLPTARLRLRPFASEDADVLFALHSSGHVLRYWDAPPWCERARAELFIAACERMAEEGSGARLAMAETDTRNTASARVLEKLGFTREGTPLREDCVVNGEVSDSWVYGLLRRHWRSSTNLEDRRT